jgi:hypothetical protein
MHDAGGDSLTEQLAIQGPAAFTPLVQSALKPYKQSVAGWNPSMQKPTVGTPQVAGASCPSCQRITQGDLTKHTIYICSACPAMNLC